MKLYIELFDPSNGHSCLCGATIDVSGIHTFCSRYISKKIIHDRIHDNTAPILYTTLKTAGIIGKGSRIDINEKGTVAKLPGLRLYNSAFHPVPSLKCTTIPPIPFTRIDLNFTPSKDMSFPQNLVLLEA